MVESLNAFISANPEITYLAAVSIALPWLLALVYQEGWSSTVKGIVSVLACFIASAGWLAVHEWATNQWVIYAVILIGATQAMYWAFRPALKQLEERTTKG